MKDKLEQREISWEEAVEEIKGIVGNFPPMKGDLIKFRPETSWLVNGLAEKHEGDHLGRVLVLAEILARVLIATGEVGAEINREAIGWGAVFHDTQINGAAYEKHGVAAAEWVEENWKEIMPFETSQETLQVVKYICQWHVSGEGEVPEMTQELKILRHADSLDRVRFDNEQRLDESFLTFEFSRSLLVPIARRLFELTDGSYASVEDGFNVAIGAGVAMGLISE
jgi:hypothetical protein